MDQLKKPKKARRRISPFWWMIAFLCLVLALGLFLLIYGLSQPPIPNVYML